MQKQSRVRDLRSDNSGEMVRMLSILVCHSQMNLSFYIVSAIHHSLMDHKGKDIVAQAFDERYGKFTEEYKFMEIVKILHMRETVCTRPFFSFD